MNKNLNQSESGNVKERKRFGFFADGMGYSLRLFRLAHDRLLANLALLESEHLDEEDHNNAVFSSVLDAWSMIDCAYNCWDLCDQFPKLPKKQPFVQLFQRRGSYLKDLRNYRQHLRGAPDRLVDDVSYPLWGALSWVSQSKLTTCFTIFSGNLMPGVNVHSISFDRTAGAFATRLELRVDGRAIDLDGLNVSVLEFRQGFLDWMIASRLGSLANGKVPVVRMEILSHDEQSD